MQKPIRKISIYILSFVCAFLIFALTVFLTIQFTFARVGFMEKQAERSNYYTLVTNEMIDKIEHYGRSGGIPREVVKGVIKENEVKKDINKSFEASLKGTDYKPDNAILKQNFKTTINNYADEHHLKRTEDSEKSITNYIDTAADVYNTLIAIPYLNQIGQKITLFKPILWASCLVLAISLIFMAIIMYRLLHWGHRLWRYLSYALSGAGLMLIALPAFILMSGRIERLSIMSKGLYGFVTTYITSFFSAFIYSGIVVILLGILAAILSERQRAKLTGN